MDDAHDAADRRCWVLTALALALAGGLTTSVPGARAQPAPARDASTARSVGGHAYSQLETVEWPFVATRVVSSTGVGVARFELAGLEPFPDARFEGEFATLDQSVFVAIAITDWLGVEIAPRAGVVGGVDSRAALLVGANGYAGGRLSGVLRLFESDAVLLSARVDVAAFGAAGIAPARTVVAAFEGGQTVRSLRPDFDGSRGSLGGSLAAVVTATDWLGFMGSFRGEARRVEIRDIEDDEGWIGGALGVSFNFGTLGVPFQLLVGSRVSWNFADDVSDVALSAIEGVEDVVFEPELGFFFYDPERPELELGLTTSFTYTDVSKRGRMGVNLGYWF